MQIATFLVPFADGGGALDEMNAFLRSHRILKVDKAFSESGWSFCVEWLEGEATASGWKKKPRIDWREKLEPEVFERFAKLRERRKALALEDGVPPYMVMTDAQMADAAKPESLTMDALKRIDGFGEARVKRYGERLITEKTT